MSEHPQSATDTAATTAKDPATLLAQANLAATGVLLLIVLILLVVVLDMKSDVSTAADQARRTLKATKALGDDLAEMKGPAPAVRNRPAAGGAQRPVHMDSATPDSDCVIRAGDPKALANCMQGAAK